MKIIKKILLIIGIIAVILLITALFVRKEYGVERQITINKPVAEVFDYVKFLKNQEIYSVWYSIDPGMKTYYIGNDGTPGFIVGWDSDNEDVGAGEQEIRNIKFGERIDYELRFIRPFKSTAHTYIVTQPDGDNKTIVKWGFNGRMNYPVNLMLLFMNFEEMIGKDFETGLLNLKIIIEKI